MHERRETGETYGEEASIRSGRTERERLFLESLYGKPAGALRTRAVEARESQVP